MMTPSLQGGLAKGRAEHNITLEHSWFFLPEDTADSVNLMIMQGDCAN